MAITSPAALHRLSESDLRVGHPDEDVRGYKVVDRDGRDVGLVDDLMIDDRDSKVRFLRVGIGGVIGLGTTMLLIPVDAVTKVEHEVVHIDQTTDHVANGPGYDPELVNDEGYLGRVYAHYGSKSYWSESYLYPLFPWYMASRSGGR